MVLPSLIVLSFEMIVLLLLIYPLRGLDDSPLVALGFSPSGHRRSFEALPGSPVKNPHLPIGM